MSSIFLPGKNGHPAGTVGEQPPSLLEDEILGIGWRPLEEKMDAGVVGNVFKVGEVGMGDQKMPIVVPTAGVDFAMQNELLQDATIDGGVWVIKEDRYPSWPGLAVQGVGWWMGEPVVNLTEAVIHSRVLGDTDALKILEQVQPLSQHPAGWRRAHIDRVEVLAGDAEAGFLGSQLATDQRQVEALQQAKVQTYMKSMVAHEGLQHLVGEYIDSGLRQHLLSSSLFACL